jgi:hypothetical protein
VPENQIDQSSPLQLLFLVIVVRHVVIARSTVYALCQIYQVIQATGMQGTVRTTMQDPAKDTGVIDTAGVALPTIGIEEEEGMSTIGDTAVITDITTARKADLRVGVGIVIEAADGGALTGPEIGPRIDQETKIGPRIGLEKDLQGYQGTAEEVVVMVAGVVGRREPWITGRQEVLPVQEAGAVVPATLVVLDGKERLLVHLQTRSAGVRGKAA